MELGGSEMPVCVAPAIVGGVLELIQDQIVAGRAAELPRRRPELMYVILVPFVGHAEAVTELAVEGVPRAARRSEGSGAQW